VCSICLSASSFSISDCPSACSICPSVEVMPMICPSACSVRSYMFAGSVRNWMFAEEASEASDALLGSIERECKSKYSPIIVFTCWVVSANVFHDWLVALLSLVFLLIWRSPMKVRKSFFCLGGTLEHWTWRIARWQVLKQSPLICHWRTSWPDYSSPDNSWCILLWSCSTSPQPLIWTRCTAGRFYTGTGKLLIDDPLLPTFI
jgi:hypothetical protein